MLENRPLKNEAGNSEEQQPSRISCILMAVLPLVSFLGQLAFSCKSGTQHMMYHHLTVMVVDWVFVPFNYFVVSVIDWHRGGRIYLIMCMSVILNIVTHAFWQYNALDPGHMINKAGVFLPAGWVHLGFSITETALLIAFVFSRRVKTTGIGIVTILATVYFVTMGICGYIMHGGFIVSDACVLVFGLFFVLVYPFICGRRKSF
jgi:hypothetical protein